MTADRVRVRAVAVGCIVLALLVSAGNVLLGHGLRTASGGVIWADFLAHWTAGRMLLDGATDRLYDPEVQAALQHALVGPGDDVAWFVGPPFTAPLYVPFAALPYLLAGVAWTALSVAMLLVALRLVRPLVPRLAPDWPLVVLVVLASAPVLETFGWGQDSAVSLLVWVVGLRLALARRDTAAGAVFGLGLLKPQLVVLAPLTFLVRRRWAAALAWTGVAVGLLLLSVVVVGVDGVQTWVSTLLGRRYDEQINIGQAWQQVSVTSLLVSVAPPGCAGATQAVGLLFSAVLVVAYLVVARRTPPAGALEMWSLAALTTVVASPHLLGYDLLVAYPALLVLLDRHGTRRVRVALAVLFAATFLTPALHLAAARLPWPATLVGASWGAVPLLVLWFEALRACRATTPTAGPRPAASHLGSGA